MQPALAAAGVQPETSEGIADFHALRHTFITTLAMSGERIKVVQELARHSKADLTLGVYTHAGLHDLQGAVDRLPVPGASNDQRLSAKATGTFGGVVERQSTECMQIRGTEGHSPPLAGTNASGKQAVGLSAFSGSNDEPKCQEMHWSDGESNPDLLNAIQPSSR